MLSPVNYVKSNSSQTQQPRHGDVAGARRRRRIRTYGIAAAVVLTATTASAGYLAMAEPPSDGGTPGERPQVHGSTVDFTVHGGTARVDTGSLRVTGHTDDGASLPVSGAAVQQLGKPGPVTVDGDTARWTYPDKKLTVTAESDHGRLRMTVRSGADQNLSWPSTAPGAHGALQIPRGEGLRVPVNDAFWNSGEAGLKDTEAELSGGLTLPAWGYTQGKHGVSYIVPEEVGTSLGFASKGGRLGSTAQHEFSRREQTRDYTVHFSLTGSSPASSATNYRAYLEEGGKWRSLKQKIRENPEVERLLGAVHAYAWGDARTAKGVNELRKLGVSRLWLGYDADDQPMDKQAVRAAKRHGYLVGPYDSYANGQPSESADNPSSKWPGSVYPDFCIRNGKGEIKEGFRGRGCYVSTQAFKQAEPGKHYLADRAKKMTANGADSYFLDVDAAGELFTDSSNGHRMNKKQDRANRLERMRKLASDDKFVLGSESAGAWAAPVLSFNHGGQTPVADGLWKLERDKEKWGGYAPQGEPATFFKQVKLPPELAKAMYDPRYRVPLYETALHGSVINTDRWEMPYNKLPDQKTDRALMSALYNTPLNFTLGDKSLMSTGKEMAALQRHFAPLHKAAGTERMTGYQRLTGDGTVQRSEFGDGKLTVTANFGKRKYGSLPGGCVDAKLENEAKSHRLCPAKLP
ncbi:glycoside hydrolase [Streptomyces sp. NBC_01381]|uniref:glycoside hydrolase n=1 Tax=Streptomyces sp. NBC_01381 TaxID=2903845 RepID=UPI00224F402B|nr:glycoside hydrolase [Streptomyces sp. NBC_01381]MCX4671878.1 glycoside hydrolase [Streptomyces sp. NBC_01381]